MPELPDPRSEDYKLALAHAVLGPHRLGLVLAAVGVVIAVIRGTVLPGIPRLVPVLFIALALGLMVIGTLRRIQMQVRHMRSQR
ncbi:hypothetical protein ASE86_13020 [Sphingomonas sp. Leaf33]|uniref:hypothetical protein n=1 Tax=Sphingomonas sp. Leaf33 TaxID=1736215 RepID=UPI0006F48FBC|nr:hypothetical protein [Sphingomonas sp. Leaf33]KQN19401.1 hypothetical protein ASE86_13020 [Sphingomonas sp. Leaf33]